MADAVCNLIVRDIVRFSNQTISGVTTPTHYEWLVLCLFFFVSPCYSQNYQVYHYSAVDGLANSSVFDITQDQWGRMWFATLGGISYYDVVDWKNYTTADGLPTQSFVKISLLSIEITV